MSEPKERELPGTGRAGAVDSGTEPVRCSVPEAARRLGITERAVRKRIQAGTLPAERVEGRWLVALSPNIPRVPRPGQSPRQSRTSSSSRAQQPANRSSLAREPKPADAPAPAPEPAPEREPSSEPEPRPKPTSVPVVPADHATELLRMMRDLQHQNLELAGQVGFLQARLASAQEQLMLTEGKPEEEPELEEEPEPVHEYRRSFFDRLFGR